MQIVLSFFFYKTTGRRSSENGKTHTVEHYMVVFQLKTQCLGTFVPAVDVTWIITVIIVTCQSNAAVMNYRI